MKQQSLCNIVLCMTNDVLNTSLVPYNKNRLHQMDKRPNARNHPQWIKKIKILNDIIRSSYIVFYALM